MTMIKLFTGLTAFAAMLIASPVLAQVAPQPTKQAAVQKAPLDGYKIGPEDVVEIDVLGQSDFKTRVRVKSDGTIPLPYLGTMNVAGQTPVALAETVGARLRSGGIYANPVVNVEVVSYASRYVIVLGEVGSPGLVPVDRGYRVSEIIARVGGIRASGAPYVIVKREDQSEMQIPFETLAKGSDADDPFVQPGDKIFVPVADKFYVYGAISAPGEYMINDELSIRKALARAGGVSPTGSEKRVKIFHDGKEMKKVDLERIVQPGDVIVVGERLF